MTTLDLRNSVLVHVQNADDRLLKMIKAIAETYQNEDNFSLSNEQYQVLDERRALHQSGESKSYSWEDIKKSLTKDSK